MTKIKKLFFSGKNSRWIYYVRSYFHLGIPAFLLALRKSYLLHNVDKRQDWGEIQERVNYYCKHLVLESQQQEAWLRQATTIADQRIQKPSTYYIDTLKYCRYFPSCRQMKIEAGDVNYIPAVPSLVKSRPIDGDNANATLLNLDKVRHFVFVKDRKPWRSKKDMVIFRGAIGQKEWNAYKENRYRFMEMYFNHPMVDAGEVIEGGKYINATWKKPSISIRAHLNYKFVMALEGNDVASNLKWVMNSNSIAVMPRPKYETWFMEGTLIPNYHYILIKDDFSDLEERLRYYLEHPDEAELIIEHAHDYVRRFRDNYREVITSLLVLDRYFQQTAGTPCVLEEKHIRISQKSEQRPPQVWQLVITLGKLNQKLTYTASSKARRDVERTLSSLNIPVLEMHYSRHRFRLVRGKAYKRDDIRVRELAVNSILPTQPGDSVIIQYHNVIEHDQTLFEVLHEHRLNIILIVHDIISLRNDGRVSKEEAQLLNMASVLYVHTSKMKAALRDGGVTVEMRTMEIFDYYTRGELISTSIKTCHNIAFAGNLEKSGFIRELINIQLPSDYSFHFYGLEPRSIDLFHNPQIVYGGSFHPDVPQISNVGWGLVWDGTSTKECDGAMGQYLMYNASHKASLYLSLGLPLIVWTQSALAEWVIRNNLGIAIDNFHDAYEKIERISPEEYDVICNNCKTMANETRQGKILKELLSQNINIPERKLPKVTVVTVCRNAAEQLKKTMQSVFAQDYPDVEYIVVDGASTDNTLEVIHRNAERLAQWISEPDKGIYDAMNKGIRMATGKYTIFMNAGDTFASPHSILYAMLRVHPETDVLYGDIMKNGSRKYSKSPRNAHRMYYCHQAVFTRTNCLRLFPFDINHKMSADFKQSKQLYLAGYNFQRIRIVIADFDTSGISNARRSDGLWDNIKVIRKTDSLHEQLRLLPGLLFTWGVCKIRGK